MHVQQHVPPRRCRNHQLQSIGSWHAPVGRIVQVLAPLAPRHSLHRPTWLVVVIAHMGTLEHPCTQCLKYTSHTESVECYAVPGVVHPKTRGIQGSTLATRVLPPQ